MENIHELSHRHESSICEDCSGHEHLIAVCSCGWERDMYGYWWFVPNAYLASEIEHLKHRLTVLESR